MTALAFLSGLLLGFGLGGLFEGARQRARRERFTKSLRIQFQQRAANTIKPKEEKPIWTR